MTIKSTNFSQRRAAIAAGIGYLIIIILTPYAWVDGLIIPGDATETAINIAASETLFRWSIASWLIVLASDAVTAWALYYFFNPVHKGLSLLAAWFRLIFVAIFGNNILNWLTALQLLAGDENFAAIGTAYIQAQAVLFFAAYEYGANVALVFFGIHIALLGYLVIKSNFIPRKLGVSLILASIGYFVDSFASILSSDYVNEELAFWIIVALPALVAEGSLTIWLLWKGGKPQKTNAWTPTVPELTTESR